MATSFRPHPNNVSAALAANYAAGSGSLVLAGGSGAAFGSTFPMLVTVATAATVGTPGEVSTIFTVTGRSTDTLTGVSAAEGTTDRAYATGDRCDVRWTSGLASAIEAAVNGVENSTGITAGVIAPARLGTGTPAGNNVLRGDGVWRPTWPVASKAGNFTIGLNENLCLCDATSAGILATLPPADSTTFGVEYIVMKNDTSANGVIVSRQGTNTILPGNATTFSLAAYGKFVRLVSTGSGFWIIVGSN